MRHLFTILLLTIATVASAAELAAKVDPYTGVFYSQAVENHLTNVATTIARQVSATNAAGVATFNGRSGQVMLNSNDVANVFSVASPLDYTPQPSNANLTLWSGVAPSDYSPAGALTNNDTRSLSFAAPFDIGNYNFHVFADGGWGLAGGNLFGNADGSFGILGGSFFVGANGTLQKVAGITNTGAYYGNGSGLTNLSAAQLTGTLPLAVLPSAVVTNGAASLSVSNGTFSGTITSSKGITAGNSGQFSIDLSGNISGSGTSATIGTLTGVNAITGPVHRGTGNASFQLGSATTPTITVLATNVNFSGTATFTNGTIYPAKSSGPTWATLGTSNTFILWSSNSIPPTLYASYFDAVSNRVDTVK